MAQGYPSRKRVRKAYARGVKAAKTGRGMNPYRNDTLKELFERGRKNTPAGVAAPMPTRASSTTRGSSSGSIRTSGSAFGRPIRSPQQRRSI